MQRKFSAGQQIKRMIPRKASFFRSPLGAKGNITYDPTLKVELQEMRLEAKHARMFYEQLWMARNVADVQAEDLTRAWFTIEIPGNPDLVAEVNKHLARLRAQNAFHSACLNEAIYGDGGIVINVADGRDPSQPVDKDNISSVRHLNAFGRPAIADIVLQNDITQANYGYATAFRFFVPNRKDIKVDASRVLHLQMRGLADDKFGSSIFLPMIQLFIALETAEWSAAQLMRMMVFRVLKSDFTLDSDEDQEELNRELEKELDALTAMLIGKDEELSWLSPTGALGGGLNALLDFLWDCYAGAARIPKSHLLGQQQGTITGASFDTKTWYNRVAGLQENYLKELAERLVEYILLAKDAGGLSVEELEALQWSIKFNPLFALSESEQADIDLKRAQERQIYYDLGVADAPTIARQVPWVEQTPMQRVIDELKEG